ncbi:hypothetical protein [Apilactobacillus quenuiae]|uniref:hypothetical protein n=1 Tax=Apilactobacillus quenuiae TaxID=2008377 RepID=UPI000D01BC23|nr:hypothetical protein [Apilactobacillus quenuiae]
MQVEKWQDIKDKLVINRDRAIIVRNDKELLNKDIVRQRLQHEGKPIVQVRRILLRDTLKKQVKVTPLAIRGWFNQHNENDNAHKVIQLISDKPTHQFKQINNQLMFFGESFLEGFLSFYGLQVDNAVKRYERQLHVLETQELGHNAKNYYLATSQRGKLKIATERFENKQVAQTQLDKFFKRYYGSTKESQLEQLSQPNDDKEQ